MRKHLSDAAAQRALCGDPLPSDPTLYFYSPIAFSQQPGHELCYECSERCSLTRGGWCYCSDRMSAGLPCPQFKCPNGPKVTR